MRTASGIDAKVGGQSPAVLTLCYVKIANWVTSRLNISMRIDSLNIKSRTSYRSGRASWRSTPLDSLHTIRSTGGAKRYIFRTCFTCFEEHVRLTLQTDYALRTLMYLATRSQRAKISDVAELFGISNAHVAKVVNQLARLGLVRSIRGIGGGIELAQPASTIRIGQVIIAFEGKLSLLDCIESDGICVIESFCKLKQVLAEAERLQTEYLHQVTLAEVVPTNRQIARIETDVAR